MRYCEVRRMDNTSHEHNWEPCAAFDSPGRACSCGWEEITKRQFKELFKQSFCSWYKQYRDQHMFGE